MVGPCERWIISKIIDIVIVMQDFYSIASSTQSVMYTERIFWTDNTSKLQQDDSGEVFHDEAAFHLSMVNCKLH
jgi:hypothetical protein